MVSTMESMDIFKVALFYVCVVLFSGENYSKAEVCGNSAGKTAAIRLSDDLFCGYNSNVRPVMNHSTQTNVKVTFFLTNFHMNEEWDVLQMSIQLLMEWKDEFLIWDPSKYDNIEKIHEHSYLLWLPEIKTFDEGFIGDRPKEFSSHIPMSMVSISNTGVIKYNHRISLNAQCATNIEKWPFDSHNCTVLMGSMLYSNKYLNFTTIPRDSGGFDLDFFNSNKEWEINNLHHDCFWIYYPVLNGSHCILRYTMNLQRYSSMYFSSIIIPAVVISLMRTFTFLMGRETFLRITLLCLFFISELLFLQFLDMKLPNNGEYVVYIVLMYRNSLILTAIAFIISVISNELYKRGTEDFPSNSPEWIKSVSIFLLNKRPISVLTNFNTHGAELLIESNMENDVPNSQRNENALIWKTISILLDRLSLIIILVISLINFWFLVP